MRSPLYHVFMVFLFTGWLLVGCRADNQMNDVDQPPDVDDKITEISQTGLELTTPDELEISNRGEFALLTWEWPEPLADNQYFDVRIWREGEPNYGVAWIKNDWFPVSSWLWEQNMTGKFLWSVALIEGENGEIIQELQTQPTPRSFTYNNEAWMQLPAGFIHELLAFGPLNSNFSGISLGPDGRFYITSHAGSIFYIDELEGDHPVAMKQLDIDSSITLTNLVDVLFIDDELFVAYGGAIGILADTNADGVYDQLTDIVTGLPSWQYWGHSNNQMALGADGKIYFGVGATTDHGPLQVENEASIMRVNPDGSELEVFATGFRNVYDLTFNANGDLFAADNAPDTLTSNEILDFFPSEELNHVVEGGHYGFPEIYSPMAHEDAALPPIATFLPSTGSAGLLYYENGVFPEDYHGGIFVAQYGSRFPVMGHGHAIVYVQLSQEDGSYRGSWENFADMEGLAPVDLEVNSAGEMFVVLYDKSVVLRITYTGVVEEPNTSERLVALGSDIYANGKAGAPACVVCHGRPEGGEINAPNLRLINETAPERVAGISAEEYIRQSIVNPNEFVVDGYAADIMFQTYSDILTDEDIDALIAYLKTFE